MGTDPPRDEEPEGSALMTAFESLAEAAGDVSIPAPVRKSLWKALKQLCTAAVDIPVATLEGIAAEKRAETEGRVRIISTVSEQIAEQVQVDPSFVEAAMRKYGQRVVREEINLSRIAAEAAKQVQAEYATSEPSQEAAATDQAVIDDDWLDSFEREARTKSSDEMQQMFAKILAGEIRHPSSFSVRTVRLLGQLDKATARRFQILCSRSIALGSPPHCVDARVPSLGGNAGANCLGEYGLSFDQLNRLEEHGLIISDYNSYMDYAASIARNGKALGFKYAGATWGLLPQEGATPPDVIKVHGVALSQAGRELLPLVNIESDPMFSEALKAFFQRNKLTMVQTRAR